MHSYNPQALRQSPLWCSNSSPWPTRTPAQIQRAGTNPGWQIPRKTGLFAAEQNQKHLRHRFW